MVLRDFGEAREHVGEFAAERGTIQRLAIGVMIEQQLGHLSAFLGEGGALSEGWMVEPAEGLAETSRGCVNGESFLHGILLRRTN